MAGYLVTMALVPWSWPAAVAGFALFRLYDVWKPWPASFFDRDMKNGLGVVLDDVAAGAWACATLAAVQFGLRLAAGCDASHWWCARLRP